MSIAFRATKYGFHPVSFLLILEEIQFHNLLTALDAAYRCLISLLPSSLRSLTFESSGSFKPTTNERSSLRRKSLLYRLLNVHVILCILYCVFAFIPLMMRLKMRLKATQHFDFHNTSFIYPGVIVKLLDSIGKMSIPVWYMAFPPTVPARYDLVVKDEKGVRRPRKERHENVRGIAIGFAVDFCVLIILLFRK